MATFPQGRGSKWSLASTKEQERGLNRRQDRQFMYDLGSSVLELGTTLGLEYAKYEKMGGKEKTMALATDAYSRSVEARAKKLHAEKSAGLYDIAQTKMFDKEGNPIPGSRLASGPQGVSMEFPDAAPPSPVPSMEGRVFDKDLVKPDGTLGGDRGDGTRPMTFAERKQLKGTGPPRGKSIRTVDPNKKDQAALAGLQAEIENLRAGPLKKRKGSPEYEAASRRLTSLHSQAAVLYRRMNMKVTAFEGAGSGFIPEPTSLRDDLKVMYPPAVFNKYKAADQVELDAMLGVATENAKLQFVNANQAMLRLGAGEINANKFLTALAKMQNPALNENLTTLAKEAAAGNKDASIIWDAIAAALLGG